ncbi:MAG TPA: phosphotransferase [Anaerolineae bacterium]|nr:phosphotransferase [Anaerolineae bacterium]
MKPYHALTRLGLLRRLRPLAGLALRAYGLAGARLTFQHYSGNIIFRADVPGVLARPGALYMPGRYNLRVLAIDDTETIASELTWLAALREADLPVPEPVPTLDGRLFLKVTTPGVPHGRVVSLMRWLEGRHLSCLLPRHARAVGVIVARLHAFSAAWQPPEGFTRFHWDWDGQFGERELGDTAGLIASMPDRFREPYLTVTGRVREVMDSFGKGPDAYGLIHADLYTENILFKAGEPRIIDFEDCGFGYWMCDIGVFLGQWPWTDDFPRIRDAFLEGYGQVRTLPDAQLRHLDLFIASQYAQLVLWSSAFMRDDPARRAEHEAWREREGIKLLRYLE